MFAADLHQLKTQPYNQNLAPMDDDFWGDFASATTAPMFTAGLGSASVPVINAVTTQPDALITSRIAAITFDKKRTVSELAERVTLMAEARGLYVLNVEGQLWTFGPDRVWTPQSDALYTIVAELDMEARQMRDELQAQLDEQLERGVLSKVQEERLRRRAQAAEANATTIGRNRGPEAIVNRIVHVPGVENITAADMDATTDKITCADGRTYNLATGQSYPARPGDRISLLVPHAPTRGTTPMFDEFLLSSSAGDTELAAAKKQLLALMLTGINAKVGWFLYGPTNSGKSAFLWAARTLLGDGFAAIGAGVFSNEKRALLDMELASAVGKLCVATEESASGSKMRTDLFKQLTGKTSQMQARRVKQDYQTVDVRFQLVMATNFLPVINVNDEAALARMMILPFHAAYDDIVTDLEEQLAAEIPALLTQLIAIAADIHHDGVKECAAASDAKATYIKSLGLSGDGAGTSPGGQGGSQVDARLTAFVDTFTFDSDSQKFVPNADIYAAYQTWAETNGVPVSAQVTQRKLTDALVAKGASRHKGTGGVRGLRGIILDNASDAAA